MITLFLPLLMANLLGISTQQPIPHSRIDLADSASTQAQLSLAISEFQLQWQQSWRESEKWRAEGLTKEIVRRRAQFSHCHWRVRGHSAADSARFVSEDILRPTDEFDLIESAASAFGACPSWLLSASIPFAQDERWTIDGAIVDEFRPSVRAERIKLIARLDSAAIAFPHSDWISGQRIRFRIDQNDFDGAAKNAQSCIGTIWWCNALRGYVLASVDSIGKAESVFVAMQRAMPDSIRCDWDDLTNLLRVSEQPFYAKMSCVDKRNLNATLWWLAKPLFRSANNERFVEQYRRLVDIALRRAILQDERYHWDLQEGGDAIKSVYERYGPPTYAAWMGANDRSHTDYLDGFKSPSAAPYTTFEYNTDRVDVFPNMHALRTPYSAGDTDWQLNQRSASDAKFTWWPRQHFHPEHPLLQLPHLGQLALFRRQTEILAAMALPLQYAKKIENTSMFDVMLLMTNDAAHVTPIDQRKVAGGSSIALRGLIPTSPTLLAIEALGSGPTAVNLRTRFSVATPPPLSAMRIGDIAQSDPVLIDVSDSTTNMDSPGESLLVHMMGSTHLSATQRRVGLYWETYGIGAGDSVTVSMRIAGDQELSALRKLGMALNVSTDPNRGVVQSWREPNPARSTRTLSGPIPVQMRTLVLDLSRLAVGPYVLEVSIEREKGKVLRNQLHLVLEN